MEVTATTGFLTDIEQVAVLPPHVALTVAVPSALAVTRPVGVTDATDAFDDDQVMLLSVALEGLTVAVSWKV